jgi:hypothetical protein
MKVQSTGPALSVVFVDYDNIYLSLKRKNEEAARRFAKDAGGWLRGVENGRLITATQGVNLDGPRRIVLNRCYGNPSPRRNPHDNSTDMNSFPFVRHHFLRAGFEVVDCPPLTAQLKNSADIKMVMDVLDFLKHQTYFDEFVLLSGDADFTPVLHRLRAHARRTVVYSNDHTATPYTAISDGEVREADLITLLMEGRASGTSESTPLVEKETAPAQLEQIGSKIMAEVASAVQASGQPVPLEALADRAIRVLGHDRTIGTNWAGAGSFRDLLARKLPSGLRLSDQPPYYVFDTGRQLSASEPAREPRRIEAREPLRASSPPPPPQRAAPQRPAATPSYAATPSQPRPAYAPPVAPSYAPAAQAPYAPAAPAAYAPPAPPRAAMAPPAHAPSPQRPPELESAVQIQQSIARIHEACQAPPLSPPDYRALFEAMAEEITANGLNGAQTLTNIAQRTLQHGAEVHVDDIRFVMEVVGEPDPWFEQGVSPILLANRFRNYVIAQCRRQQMTLSATEIDLIEMWFTGSGLPAGTKAPPMAGRRAAAAPHGQPAASQPGARAVPPKQDRADRWWHLDGGNGEPGAHAEADDLPRIVRQRPRG